MFDIRADKEKNRIILKLSGFLQQEELKRATDEFIEKVKTLQPGFDIINDISEFKPASQEGAAEIKRAQAFIKEHGFGHVIRVIPGRPDPLNSEETTAHGTALLGKAQFRRTAREVGYQAGEASSIEEAEAMLDRFRR